MEIPAPLRQAVEDRMQIRIQSAEPVGGGCIHRALRLVSNDGLFFLKWNPAPQTGMFSSEARALDLIRETMTIATPMVYLWMDPPPDPECPSFILMEWIERRAPDSNGMTRLGQQLAAFHRITSSLGFGWDQDNFIGLTRQQNGWNPSWPEFFVEKRLRPMQQLAEQNRLLPLPRARLLDRLIDRVPALLDGHEPPASMLHGDLWAGNLLFSTSGQPVFLDPALYFGDREAEMAYTGLFGGFSSTFYAAYQASWPLEKEFPLRRDLYNLYHLLNHLNLFGEEYGASVDAILHHYAGG